MGRSASRTSGTFGEDSHVFETTDRREKGKTMQVIAGIMIIAAMAALFTAYIKLYQFKNPKAAFWYYMGAYCISNGDAEMRRIERQMEHYKIMEDLCGGKITSKGTANDRQAQNI